MSDQPYFPGKDYPDREEWLKRRTTVKREPRVIYSGNKPLQMGINNAKRRADASLAAGGFGGRRSIIEQRHRFWRSRHG